MPYFSDAADNALPVHCMSNNNFCAALKAGMYVYSFYALSP